MQTRARRCKRVQVGERLPLAGDLDSGGYAIGPTKRRTSCVPKVASASASRYFTTVAREKYSVGPACREDQEGQAQAGGPTRRPRGGQRTACRRRNT